MTEHMGRPNDVRGFVHKKLFGGFKTVLGVGARIASVTGIPGISHAGSLVSSVLPGGSRNTQFVSARSAQLARGQAVRRFQGVGNMGPPTRLPGGLPQSSPMRTNVVAQNAVAAATNVLATTGECPRGFHRNKTTYRLVSSGDLVVAGSRCVRNRRRNPDNGKASLRAARRLLARQKHAKTIDDALRSLAPRKSSRRSPPAPRAGGPIVVAS